MAAEDRSRGLAHTARFTAAVRARESERADALFSDPWAATLAGEDGFAALARLGERAALWPVVRTRFLDDLLRDTLLPQVVLPAAGLDARAYRLAWPDGTRLFEIDQPELLAAKEQMLAQAIPRCQRVTLAADLQQPWAERLIDAGFDAQQPAVWLVEGLLMYLDEQATQHIMQTISRLAVPGSWLGLDLPQRSLRGHVVNDPTQWLTDLGWRAEVASLADVAARYGRWPHPRPPADNTAPAPLPMGRVWLIAARKEAAAISPGSGASR
jgi:methyltransferase (TIGR00027 family)